MITYDILLVHNKLRLTKPITYLSLLIRLVTGGRYNHIAIRYNDRVIESIGKGVIDTSYEEWFDRSDRRVLPMHVPFSISKKRHSLLMSRIGNHYGIWDLLSTGVYFILKKRLGINVPKPINGCGDICSELALILLDIDDVLVPHEFETLSDLVKGLEFETYEN
jgi:hypothetical protein